MSKIQNIELQKIKLDYQNPRLGEFGINISSTENEILEILWNEMAVNELMYSIVSNGFWDYEPLIILKDNDDYIAVEGNRRLAAVKLIHDQSGLRIPAHIIQKVTRIIRPNKYIASY